MSEEKHWWNGYPWRMVQTNMREIDMEDIDAEEYAGQLADFGATVVLLNAAGILASYDTKHPYQAKSAYLHGDSLKQIVEACHNRGMKVIARTDFSKVHYDLYEKHPDWAYRTAKGDIVNYNGDVQVCPNGEYQQKIRFEILKEVLTEIPFDGVFCNMGGFQVVDYDFKYYGPCHCENCKRLFREQYGLEIPDRDDFTNPDYRKYMEFKGRVTAKAKMQMKACLQSVGRDLAQNNLDFIRTESNAELEEMYGGPSWVYSASTNSRLTSGHDHRRPSDNASVDFIGFRYRDVSVSPALMELRQWQNLANSGCLSLYIMGRLDNHRDVSGFEPTRKVFRFHAEHEGLYANMKSAAKVLLVRQGNWQRIDPETAGWIRALTESHVPFDELNLSEMSSAEVLAPYRTVILGNIRGVRPDAEKAFEAFVRDGGKLIATGETKLSCLGIAEVCERRNSKSNPMFYVGEEDKELFPHCADAPYIAVGDRLQLVRTAEGAQTCLTFIDEHPFGPPERCYYTEDHVKSWPGVILNHSGKGLAVTVPFCPGQMYRQTGHQNTLNFMRDLMDLAGARSIAPGLTPMCEITFGESGGKKVIQLVNTTGCFSNSFFAPVPLRDLVIELPEEFAPEVHEVSTLNGGDVSMEKVSGGRRLTLDHLNDYEAIVLA